MKCVHLGDKSGSLVAACCGGGERRTDLYECLSDEKAQQYTVPNGATISMAPIEIDGQRSMQSVAGCVGCRLYENDILPPMADEREVKGNAYAMWEALRMKRSGVRPKLERVAECFRTYVHQETPIKTRHLLYHIWPRTGSTWREHVAGIERRLSLFNGKKIIAVATGEGTDDVDITWADEIIRIPNNPRIREVATFIPMLEHVADMGPDEAVFNCHSKGVTHRIDNGTTVHLWSDLMLEVLVDHWKYIGGLLASYPIVGAFKKLGRSLSPTTAEWHYTGTYYWFRNDVFSRDWRKVDQTYWGTESWPGVHFDVTEGGCAFLSGSPSLLNLYDMNFMLKEVEPRLELFRSLMEEYRQ